MKKRGEILCPDTARADLGPYVSGALRSTGASSSDRWRPGPPVQLVLFHRAATKQAGLLWAQKLLKPLGWTVYDAADAPGSGCALADLPRLMYYDTTHGACLAAPITYTRASRS